MNIKAAYRYQLDDHKKAIITYYIILLAIYILLISSISISVSSTETITYTDSSSDQISIPVNSTDYNMISGMELATVIFLFIVGLDSFKEVFGMLLQNGISRRTLFASRCLTTVSIALIMSVIDKIILLVLKSISLITNENLFVKSLYEQSYRNNIEGIGSFLFHIESFIFNILLYLFVITLGYFIRLVYYRVSKPVRITISITIPTVSFILLPMIDEYVTKGKIYRAFSDFIHFSFGHPLNAIISFAIGATIFCSLSWLVIRRVSIKE